MIHMPAAVECEPMHFMPASRGSEWRIVHGVPLIGAGIGAILSGSGEFEVSASPTSHNPTDVLIADIEVGLRALSGSSVSRNVLIVAHDDGEGIIRKALGKGARGFLLHTCGAEEPR